MFNNIFGQPQQPQKGFNKNPLFSNINQPRNNYPPCIYCNRTNHISENCRFKDKQQQQPSPVDNKTEEQDVFSIFDQYDINTKTDLDIDEKKNIYIDPIISNIYSIFTDINISNSNKLTTVFEKCDCSKVSRENCLNITIKDIYSIFKYAYSHNGNDNINNKNSFLSTCYSHSSFYPCSLLNDISPTQLHLIYKKTSSNRKIFLEWYDKYIKETQLSDIYDMLCQLEGWKDKLNAFPLKQPQKCTAQPDSLINQLPLPQNDIMYSSFEIGKIPLTLPPYECLFPGYEYLLPNQLLEKYQKIKEKIENETKKETIQDFNENKVDVKPNIFATHVPSTTEKIHTLPSSSTTSNPNPVFGTSSSNITPNQSFNTGQSNPQKPVLSSFSNLATLSATSAAALSTAQKPFNQSNPMQTPSAQQQFSSFTQNQPLNTSNSIFGKNTSFGNPNSTFLTPPNPQNPQNSVFGNAPNPGFNQPSCSAQVNPAFSNTSANTSFAQPQSKPFGQPQTSTFGQPQTSTFGQPQTMNSTFGQPQTMNSTFGQPQNSTFGQPQNSTFGQPSRLSFQKPVGNAFFINKPQQVNSFGFPQSSMPPVGMLPPKQPDNFLDSLG